MRLFPAKPVWYLKWLMLLQALAHLAVTAREPNPTELAHLAAATALTASAVFYEMTLDAMSTRYTPHQLLARGFAWMVYGAMFVMLFEWTDSRIEQLLRAAVEPGNEAFWLQRITVFFKLAILVGATAVGSNLVAAAITQRSGAITESKRSGVRLPCKGFARFSRGHGIYAQPRIDRASSSAARR